MTYETFKAAILSELSGYFPPDTSITIQAVSRNNQYTLDGLTILESGLHIAPTLYLQEYYKNLQQGMSFSAVLKRLIDTYYQYRPTENIDVSFFEDFSQVSKHIVFRLIHYERNRKLLASIPHIPYLDLAIVFCCLISAEPAGNASILIHNDQLELWKVKRRQLFLLARENTPSLMTSCCDPMSSLLTGILPFSHSAEDIPCTPIPMYVLTNRQRFYGSSCLLYDNLLADMARQMDTDFYVIPSSIHEVILVPAAKGMKREDFNEMIREVNTTQLSPDEILSDHVYYYNRQSNKLSS